MRSALDVSGSRLMRTLVLGGGGMLARAVVAEGRRRGLALLALPKATADLTDAARLLYWAEAFRPEAVLNCAAYTQVDACETERERAFAVNDVGVGHAVAAARSVGARFVQVSTDYVFDGSASTPYREDSPTGPVSVYGASKLGGEHRALAYERSLVVRTSWVFGEGGPSFPATILRLLEQGKTPLRVVDDQLGAPTYTRFLATALLDLAATEATGILHFQNRDAVTWYEFAREIARAVAPGAEVLPVKTSEFPRPAPRPAYSVLDVARCEARLGRRVEPWSWGLAEFLERSARKDGAPGGLK